MKFTIVETGVVSKSLAKTIRTFVEEGLQTVQVQWDQEVYRHSFIEVVEDHLEQQYAQGKITHGKVICDDRNNSSTAFKEGKFQMHVQFRQKNAIIDTKFIFHIEV